MYKIVKFFLDGVEGRKLVLRGKRVYIFCFCFCGGGGGGEGGGGGTCVCVFC